MMEKGDEVPPRSGRVSSELKDIHPKSTANIEFSGGFCPSLGRAGIYPIFFSRIVGQWKSPVGYPNFCAGLIVRDKCVKKIFI